MISFKSLSRYRFVVVLWPLFLLAIIFWEPFTTARTIFHMDWAPYFAAGSGHGFWRIFVEIGWAPGFMNFLWALLPDRLFHLLFYPVIVFAIWAVLFVFFRNRKLPWPAAMAGALAGAFSGYLTTLISAGHRNVFEAYLSIVIILLCIDRVVRGGSIWYGIAAALAAAFTLGTQPDVLGLMGLFVAAYAVMACWWRRETLLVHKGRFGLTFVLACLVFAITVLPALYKLRYSTLPRRAAEITQQMEGSDKAASAAKQWEFVTNWSLPLADTPELILPLFFGTETTDREAPFWGELGRTLGWEPGSPGFRNYRQHTVYIGLLQVLLALFAVGCLMNKRCRQALVATKEERRQIIFWGLCALVALLLSLGRYTPFYRLFYALPFAQMVRAPVKILHVVNLAVAILTAYGVALLLRAFPRAGHSSESQAIAKKAAKWLAISSGGLVIVLLVTIVCVQVASNALATGWLQMGYDASLHPAMRRHMFLALWRSAGLATGLGISLYLLILRRSAIVNRPAAIFGIILCGAIGLDMSLTARRFVNTIDLSVHESQNAIVDDVRRDVSPRILDLLTSRQPHDPLRVNFERYHAGSVRLLDAELPQDGKLLAEVGNDFGKLVRVLQITGTEYVVGTREQLSPWIQHELFTLVGSYDFANRIIPAYRNQQGRILLLRLQQTLPRAAWVPSARVVEGSAHDEIFNSSFNPWKNVLLAADSGDQTVASSQNGSLREANITNWSRWRVKIDDVPSEGGILLINEPYDREWKAYSDGQPMDVALANGAMMAVNVPAGSEQVVFLRQPGLRFFWISTVPAIGLFVLLLARIFWWLVRSMSGAEEKN